MGAPQIQIEKSYLIKYYSRPEIQNAIFEAAKNREVGVQFANGGYGKRPDILQYPSDVIEYAIIAADLIIKALQYYNVPVTIKFSGRAGFHIAVPWEAFPETVESVETRLLFPEAPKKIALYLENMIEKPLAEELLKTETIDELQKKTQIPMEKLVVNGKFKVFEILHIDTVLMCNISN